MNQSSSHIARFRYEGKAHAVRLQTFMPRFPSPLDFVGQGDLWELELELPSDSRIEYRLEVVEDGHSRTILDPLNPSSASNPFGVNSVYAGPEYRDAHWPPGGETTEIRVRSAALGGRRHHVLHSPTGSDPATPLPLVIVHDGSDYIQHAGLLTCLTTLRSEGSIPPVRVLGLNPRERDLHYVASDRHADHVVEETLPHVADRVAVGDQLILVGASLGAVAAWHIAQRHRRVFAGLLLQSGTFALAPHPELPSPMYESINGFVTTALEDPGTETMSVAQTCGRWESLIDWNRTVADSLAGISLDHQYRETWTGHDWGAWSGSLRFGLVSVLGRLDGPGSPGRRPL